MTVLLGRAWLDCVVAALGLLAALASTGVLVRAVVLTRRENE